MSGSRWRSLSILGFVAVLAAVGLGVAASAQPGGEVEPDSDALYRTTKTVCQVSDAMGETSCATALLESRVLCTGFYRCEVVSQLSLVTQGSRDDFEALGTAGSQALGDTRAEAWIQNASQTGPVKHVYESDEIPAGGKSVSYESQVCVRFTLSPEETGGGLVSSESVCEDWSHHVWLRPGCYECPGMITGLFFAGSGIPRTLVADAVTVPVGVEERDRSSARVCGELSCGAGRVLHAPPSCTGTGSDRTCTVDYWIEAQTTGYGCVTVSTDQFSDEPVHCVEADGSGQDSHHGPFSVSYDVPDDGRMVTVTGEVCLGDHSYTSQCTQWSPATIELSGG